MILICIAVRMKSSRCPKKALADLAGEPLLYRLIERVSQSGYKPVVCTSTNKGDNVIETLCRWHGVTFFRGDEMDVMSRFITVADTFNAKHIVRVTGDNPLTDPNLIIRMVDSHLEESANYTRIFGPPKGTRPEIIRTNALKILHQNIDDKHETEYMTYQLQDMTDINTLQLKGDGADPQMRLTVDTPTDLKRVRKIYEHFNGYPPTLPELTVWVRENLTDYYVSGQELS